MLSSAAAPNVGSYQEDRYRELVAKRDSESLVPDGPEHQGLIQMTDTIAEWNARRMGLLFELAKLRNTPIDEVST